ncbi:putative germin-like protein 9-2 isoform X2 [Ricinus communis]|uniref:putative germin-like protein 9-2 isoform X2 n=1 Tax=Ricinus communis TaxID=3988 RepID=UPI00201AE894|nr:putative germin-like protein 9-2 isoform X2 [Ricinus communis]
MGKLSSYFAIPLILAIGNAVFVTSSDPDILKDFLVPPSLDPNTITRQYFTFTGFRLLRNANLTGKTTALVTKATMKEFPALEGQGVSVSAIIYPPSGMNLPHIHPRASELLIVLQGSLQVGFVDTTNKLFTQTIEAPDMFIFPKGLVHFQVNMRNDSPAYALGVFGSANGGTVSLPSTVFGSGIPAETLAKAFKTDEETISKLIGANE